MAIVLNPNAPTLTTGEGLPTEILNEISKKKKVFLLDASLASRAQCKRRVYYLGVMGYRAPILPVDIVYGNAFHKFIEHMLKTQGNFAVAIKSAREAFDVPMTVPKKKQWMNENHLMSTCIDYWNQYAKRDEFEVLHWNDKPMVEVKFVFPYYSDDEVDILLCGTLDRIGKFRSGCYANPDFKVSGTYDPKAYFEAYRLSPQFCCYRLAIKAYAQKFPGSIWEVLDRNELASFIDLININSSKETEFLRSPMMFFRDREMSHFLATLEAFVKDFVPFIKTGVVPHKEGIFNGACQERYFPCPFFNACACPDDISEAHVLKNNFIIKQYNPMEFR